MAAFPEAVETVFFDLDDTLVAYDAVTGSSWRQACQTLEAELGVVGIDAAVQTIQRHSAVYWNDELRARQGRQDLIAARRTFVREAFDELGIPSATAVRIADLFSKVRIENMCLLPHATETLADLQSLGVALALVTNGESTGQRGKVARFGLESFFQLILVEGDIGVGKPDPRIFRAALGRMGAIPERTLMVGDNLVWDISGAQSVGMRGIWYDWRNEDARPKVNIEPFARIRDLSELQGIVRK